eukprot:10988227-Ditylum_brightwellii.AAC.1
MAFCVDGMPCSSGVEVTTYGQNTAFIGFLLVTILEKVEATVGTVGGDGNVADNSFMAAGKVDGAASSI